MTKSSANPSTKSSVIWQEIKAFIIIMLIALAFRSLAYEPFHIPSGSMKDNLLIGDYIFVSKYSYGYSRFSFPFSLPLFEGRIFSDNLPQRGDIAVFRPPKQDDKNYVKRVIGLPGDRIQMIDSVLYINLRPVRLERISDYETTEYNNIPRKIARFVETLPPNPGSDQPIQHTILEITNIAPNDNTREFIVPDGHYFMMGDNRDNSNDSREMNGFGFVPLENFIGKAELVVFSLEEGVSWWQFWKVPFSFRGDRFFKKVDF